MVDESRFYKELLDNLYDGVYFIDKDMTITYWNRSAEKVTGYKSEEVVGTKFSSEILGHMNEDGEPVGESGNPLKDTLGDGKTREAEIYLHCKDGRRVPVSVRITAIRDEGGGIAGGVEVFSDRSSALDAVRRIQELQKISLLCPLTGIGNRRFAEMTLSRTFSEFHRHGWPFGAMFIDIDHFKKCNDSYGHAFGDEILRTVAGTLDKTLRTYDFLGRWGGEEFLAVLPNVSEDALRVIAERARRVVEQTPTPRGDQKVGVTVSIGATLAGPDDSPKAIVERVDGLMYQSKTAGRNRVTLQ